MSQLDKAAQRHKGPSIPVSVIAPSRKKQSKQRINELNKVSAFSVDGEREYAEK